MLSPVGETRTYLPENPDIWGQWRRRRLHQAPGELDLLLTGLLTASGTFHRSLSCYCLSL